MSASSPVGRLRQQPAVFLAWAALLVCVLWAYSARTAWLVRVWWTQPDYLYGFLVPGFSLLLLWLRREMILEKPLRGSLWGLVLLGAAGATRGVAAYYYIRVIDGLSLVPCAAGIALTVAGWRGLRWAWPSILFLGFMVPLPGMAATMPSRPLQRIGTVCGTYLLQTCGVPAVAQGNVIVLTDVQIGVVEACSGLRMLMLFLAVCVGAAFLMRRPVWERVFVVLSAVPVAIVANVARITVTGFLHETLESEWADVFYHDLAGWFMMPMAVVLLWLEVGLLRRVALPPPPAGPVAIGTSPGSAPRSERVSSNGRRRKSRRRAARAKA